VRGDKFGQVDDVLHVRGRRAEELGRRPGAAREEVPVRLHRRHQPSGLHRLRQVRPHPLPLMLPYSPCAAWLVQTRCGRTDTTCWCQRFDDEASASTSGWRLVARLVDHQPTLITPMMKAQSSHLFTHVPSRRPAWLHNTGAGGRRQRDTTCKAFCSAQGRSAVEDHPGQGRYVCRPRPNKALHTIRMGWTGFEVRRLSTCADVQPAALAA
jgi:hypothetical protein